MQHCAIFKAEHGAAPGPAQSAGARQERRGPTQSAVARHRAPDRGPTQTAELPIKELISIISNVLIRKLSHYQAYMQRCTLYTLFKLSTKQRRSPTQGAGARHRAPGPTQTAELSNTEFFSIKTLLIGRSPSLADGMSRSFGAKDTGAWRFTCTRICPQDRRRQSGVDRKPGWVGVGPALVLKIGMGQTASRQLRAHAACPSS